MYKKKRVYYLTLVIVRTAVTHYRISHYIISLGTLHEHPTPIIVSLTKYGNIK